MKMLWHDILFGIFKKRSCKTKKKQPKKGRKIKLKISIRHIAKWDKIRTKKNKIELRINNGFQVFYCTIYLFIVAFEQTFLISIAKQQNFSESLKHLVKLQALK